MSYSQSNQDIFVLKMFPDIKGTYLEIGASHPIDISNTYLLEQNGWTGLSLEIDNSCQHIWHQKRKNDLIITNALTFDYSNLPNYIDYLQLDIEPSENTLECLKRLMTYPTRYGCITFEHDYYINPGTINESREILEQNGYKIFAGGIATKEGWIYEDWWVDLEKINKENFDLYNKGYNFNSYMKF